jgi:hypothetical protein
MVIDGSEKDFIDGIGHKLWLSSVLLEVALINNLSLKTIKLNITYFVFRNAKLLLKNINK